jgi:hypothetical protein
LFTPTIPTWIAPAVPNAASPTRRLSFSRSCDGQGLFQRQRHGIFVETRPQNPKAP